MADLYDLLGDDNLLQEEREEEEEETKEEQEQDDQDQPQEEQQPQGEEWDHLDREHVELQQPQQPPDPSSNDDDDMNAPLELQDLFQQPQQQPQQHQDVNNLQDNLYYYSKLKGLWTQELLSPELLPYDADTMTHFVDTLADREDMEITGNNSTGNASLDSLMDSILKVDAQRCKFVLCHLMRERLRKLEEHPRHYLANMQQQEEQQEPVDENETTNNSSSRMSENEKEFLTEYTSLLDLHLRKTVLDHVPNQEVWKKLDTPDMIDGPDLATYVFVRTKEEVTIERNKIGMSNRNENMDNDDNGNINLERNLPHASVHDKGACLIVLYSTARELFLQDKVELLGLA